MGIYFVSLGGDTLNSMDWLSKNHNIIHCNNRKVFLARDIEIGKKLFFRGEIVENQLLIISYVKGTKYL